MQIIELKPSNHLHFKLPNTLSTKFTIGNLTLRTVCIYMVPLHEQFVSVDCRAMLIDAFQEVDVGVVLHWSQAMKEMLRSKLRVYIWELYDQEGLGAVVGKMFEKETDGNCLLFQELTIDIEIDSNYLQPTTPNLPNSYLLSPLPLPYSPHALPQLPALTEQTKQKILSHCQKLGKIKAIYTYGYRYIIQFSQLEDIVCSFCQVRDEKDRLIIFGIGGIGALGGFGGCSPGLVYVGYADGKGGHVKKENNKESQKKKYQEQPKYSNKKIKQEQKQQEQQQQNQKNISTNEFQPAQKPIKPDSKPHPQFPSPTNPKQKPKDLTKQSFFMAPQTRTQGRKRTKSQNLIKSQQQQFSSTSIDIDLLNSWRNAKNFQIKSQKVYEQKSIDFSKKILNIELSSDEQQLYILLRDCVIVCNVDLSNKRVIKFDPIDSENVNLPTPMILLNRERTVIFANQSYLFWVSLVGDEEPDWKYVQRKEIYAIQVIQELNLLMVGGKNFSKLAYLGKSTSRSNIKVYSSGKTGKRQHLFTYDIPNCNGQHITSLKHITTKPNNTKLLTALTHNNKLFFLRVRAFNHIEVFSCIDTTQIGIQEIVSMRYYEDSNILVCLEKLSEEAYCFKYVKVGCSYEKVELATESLKMPVERYVGGWRIGGRMGEEWLTAIDSKNCIYSFYLQWKQPQKSEYKVPIKQCILLKRGAIFREPTQIKCRILKQ